MKLLDQLNLRPQERRVLVAVAFLCFLALNWIFIFPLFGQWSVVQNDLRKAQGTLQRYSAEIAKTPTYEALEKKLKSTGSDVLSEELALQRIVDTQARAASVQISRFTPGIRSATGRTNQFFEDQGLSIDISTGGKELVDFLVGMASGNSMVRVQEMSLRPDPSQTKLVGNILFVASYQKKMPLKAAATAPTTATTTPKPTAAPPKPATNTVKTAAPPAKPATNTVKTPMPTNFNRGLPVRPPSQTNSTKLPKK
jgi:hypothetical protein